MMDPTLKQKWLEALRSGKYKQGKGALCVANKEGEKSYCCLGVLNEIVHGEDSWKQGCHYEDGTTKFMYDQDSSLPTHEDIVRWGIGSVTPLTTRNDGRDAWVDNQQTFDQIADFIEEEY